MYRFSQIQEIQYKNEKKIVLTPTLLLDNGPLGQVIFSDPHLIDPFGRKITKVVLNTFANTNNPFVELIIDSKPPEWDESGIIPAQHKIVVMFHKFKPSLYGTKFPWPCTQFSVEEQLKHWTSKVIGRQFHWSRFEFEEYILVIEDETKKIYSKHPLLEVPFFTKTKLYKIDGALH